MGQIIAQYWVTYLTVHWVCGFIGLWIELLNNREIRVAHLFWAIIFGPFFMFTCMADFDRVLIKLPDKKK